MRLRQLYDKVIEIGIEHDPRDGDSIEAVMARWEKAYSQLSDKEKEFFDKELLRHPFADTRILNGTGEEEIESVFVGIDIDVSEVVLVDRMREKGERIDALISHHPSARAWAQFYEVMDMQTDILEHLGVNPVVSEKLLQERKAQVKRKVMPANHFRGISAAQILQIPWMCAHTPADNCVYDYLKELFERQAPRSVGDIIDILYEIPEYQEGARRGSPPVILLGNKSNRAGKVALEMTGGTEPSVENYQYLAQSGTGTIVGMHFSEEHYKKAKEARLNLIVAGHMASDTLGMNLLLDEIEASLGHLNILSGSGFYRISHR